MRDNNVLPAGSVLTKRRQVGNVLSQRDLSPSVVPRRRVPVANASQLCCSRDWRSMACRTPTSIGGEWNEPCMKRRVGRFDRCGVARR